MLRKLNAYCVVDYFHADRRLMNAVKFVTSYLHLNFRVDIIFRLKPYLKKISEIGITVDKSLQHYPWTIVYDMEAILLDQNDESHSIWTNEHQPISVALASNVPEYEDIKFIYDPEEESLVKQRIDHMNLISSKAYDLAKLRWKCVFESFEKLEQKWCTDFEQNDADNSDNDLTDACTETNVAEPPSKAFLHAVSKENVFYDYIKRLQTDDQASVEYNDWSVTHEDNDGSNIREDSNDSTEADEDERETDMTAKRLMSKLIAQYKEEFDVYCKQIPCIGYNSGKYDINLVKKKLVKHLGLHLKSGYKFVIKKEQQIQLYRKR